MKFISELISAMSYMQNAVGLRVCGRSMSTAPSVSTCTCSTRAAIEGC
jgi:hypothetical protein